MFFKEAGIALQRVSYLQANDGVKISADEAIPGDLIFFAHSGDQINHVGIVTSEPAESLHMIHASSSKGVIHTNVANSSYWYSKIKGARRVI